MADHWRTPHTSSRQGDGAVHLAGSRHHALGQTRELNLSPPELRFSNSPWLQLGWDLLAISAGALLVSAFVAGIGSGFAVLLYYLFSLGE